MALINTRVSAGIGANLTGTPALSTSTVDVRAVAELLFAAGTGANQADRIYTATGTINASTTLSLDMSGSLLQPDGTAFVIVEIVGLVLKNTHATQSLTLQRPASNGVPIFGAASGSMVVGPGGFRALGEPSATGIVVTASTGDIIDLVNGAGSSVTYELAIAGRSA